VLEIVPGRRMCEGGARIALWPEVNAQAQLFTLEASAAFEPVPQAPIDDRQLLRAAARWILGGTSPHGSIPVPLAPQAVPALWRDLRAQRLAVVASAERGGEHFLLLRACGPVHGSLTRREHEVATLAAAGHANKAIAYELGITISTVSVYLMKASRKLGAASRVELIHAWQVASRAQRVAARIPAGARGWEVEREGAIVVAYPAESGDLPADLTAAQREVAAALLDGQSNAEIALARGRSARTIANQVASIFRRLGVASRGELAARYGPRPSHRNV
jgi:DNA-binding NarL/FixJ family response regulator